MKFKKYQQFASVYDRVYNNKFYHNYANFFIKIIKKRNIKDARILDIGCGTGRLIKEFTKSGIKSEGLDKSKEMIAIAVKNNKGIKFYNQEFISFYTGKKYNAITCTFDSINYITSKKDLYKMFKKIKNHLKNGGIFIFDFNTIYKKVKNKIVKNGITFKSFINNNIWNVEIIFKKGNRVYTERHKERLYSFKEIESVVSKSGFRIIGIYSNFKNKINKINRYQRLIIVAKEITCQ